jgi:hypothetical protein
MPPTVTLGVWTVKQGRIVPYAPADGLGAVGVDDIDTDGRPDLLLDSQDALLGPGCDSTEGDFPQCMAQLHTSFRPDQAAHSLPDGSFSTTDAVAKKAAVELSPEAAP